MSTAHARRVLRAAACVLPLACAGSAPDGDAVTRPVPAVRVGPFVLETELRDAGLRADAASRLAAAIPRLERLALGRPREDLLLVVARSEADRFTTAHAERAGRGELTILPASASRGALRAVLALPRAELDPWPAALGTPRLPDSTRTTLVHEATHLWLFAALPGEERIPGSLHEGVAEWIAEETEGLGPDGAPAPTFSRESVPELRRAAARGELPDLETLLAVAPRASPSPQLWSAAAWLLLRTVAREAGPEGVADWLRRCAAGEDARSALAAVVGDPAPLWDLALRGVREAAPARWAMGRDVTVLEDGDARSLLLAPLPGRGVWCFEAGERETTRIVFEAEVEGLGGGAPELFVGFGFDDGADGVRVAVSRGGRATVEAVEAGVPLAGAETEVGPLGSGPLPRFRLRVEREDRRVRIRAGAGEVELPMPPGRDAPRGRIGVGARGGAFLVRDLRIESVRARALGPSVPDNPR